jgi:prepilin-type N-terminal cleavage/methylation domain-containing protein/prepilin-type processing-associated H-X9-DG protein
MKPPAHSSSRAFTLIELLVVIAIIAILASLILPALARAKAKAKETQCQNSLKQMTLGFRSWANDHDNYFPWQLTRVESGSRDSDDWTDHFKACSNEFYTPVFLTCPTDQEKTSTMRWDLLTGERNISYFIGLNSLEAKPDTIVAGDCNVMGGGGGKDLSWNQSMGSSIDATWKALKVGATTVRLLHQTKGNVALADGSVRLTTTPALRELISTALAVTDTNVVISLPRGIL